MAELIQLIFENDKTIDIVLNNNTFSKKWTSFLSSYIEKVPNYHEYEIQISGIEKDKKIKELLKVIDMINCHIPSTIDDKYTNKFQRVTFSYEELSDIHYVYEKIAADDNWIERGNLSNTESFYYRGKLNDLIHETEAIIGKRVLPRIRFRIVDPLTKIPNTEKIDFDNEDYFLFDPIMRPYTVYLNYNAVGEDFIKTFKSNRPANTAVPLTKYSPSFFFVTQSIDYNLQKHSINRCRQWMQESGYNSYDPKTSFGYLPIGTIFKNMSDSELIDVIQTDKIKDIKIQ